MRLIKNILSISLFLCANNAFAQGVLVVNDESMPNEVYAGADDNASVMIKCHKSIPLTFSSSMDKIADPYKVELQGSDSLYYLRFPTGKIYRGRELSIIASGYITVTHSLDLVPKQSVILHVIDPNATVDAGCYREHRNKGMLDFKNANYEEARNQFVVARECSDVDSIENEKNILLADSMIYYRTEAEEAYKLLDYVKASDYYTKIIEKNANDTYAQDRKSLCINSFLQECDKAFSMAEFYYTERDFEKAKIMYGQVISKECTKNMAIATERLNTIKSLERVKKDHARVITYEYMKDVPLGFSYGKFNKHKVGGFFQLDFNTTIFDAIRGDCRYGDTEFPELNMAIGWTVKVYDPVWVHFGPGLTGKMYYGTYLDDHYPNVGYGESNLLDTKEMGTDLTLPRNEIPKGYEDGWEKTNFAVAISPVIGITVKYSYFAFRLSYSYRWSIQSKLKDFMGISRLSVGVGVAF